MYMSENQSHNLTHLRRRTVLGLLRGWKEVEGLARSAVGGHAIRPALPKDDLKLLRNQMQICLESPGGEITERANTAELGRIYLGLNEEGRKKFLQMLATDFDVDNKKLATLAKNYGTADEPASRLKLEIAMRQALTTPRSTILRQFTALPDGFKFLINLRSDLQPLIGKDSYLQGLEFDLKTILSAWFDIALLDMAEISWQSPAALLEKLIEYEAVHRVASWDDLKNRLDADRRVFAFFHNKMPLEPLIFVHVALVSGMSDNIQVLLDETSPVSDVDQADTAIFYSISNAQRGLAGISFGNFLIKRVVSQLSVEMPHIRHFATLSPIPGFRPWLDPQLAAGDDALLKPTERRAISEWCKGKPYEKTPAKALHALLDTPWHKEPKLVAMLKPMLMRLCASYLINEKKGGRPLDPVAGFHLFNGARLERMNWLADISPKGLKQSAGLMVNYYYKLSDIDKNHEEFVTEGTVVAARPVQQHL
jgi:malonyl-CoA decarboxylase